MVNFKIFVTIVGIIMAFGYYPQAYTIWKSKSADNISISTFGILAFGMLTWFIYGIIINDWPIILSYGPALVGTWVVFILALIYKYKK